MQRGGLLEPIAEKQCELTDLGRKWLADIAGGYPVKLGHREGVAHLCLDWTRAAVRLRVELGKQLGLAL